MSTLPTSAVQPILETLIEHAASTATGADGVVAELQWIESFHRLIGHHLEDDIRGRLRAVHDETSVNVASALVHGTTFAVRVPPPGTGGTEIGDVLVVGEELDEAGETAHREALLFQMKVGLSLAPSGPSSANQLRLYNDWNDIFWCLKSVRNSLSVPHPRQVKKGPRSVARFGLLPRRRGGGQPESRDVVSASTLSPSAEPLSKSMAEAACLQLQIPAWPVERNGWSRVVQDILDVAGIRSFKSQPRLHRVDLASSPTLDAQGRMLVIVVRSGGSGVAD